MSFRAKRNLNIPDFLACRVQMVLFASCCDQTAEGHFKNSGTESKHRSKKNTKPFYDYPGMNCITVTGNPPQKVHRVRIIFSESALSSTLKDCLPNCLQCLSQYEGKCTFKRPAFFLKGIKKNNVHSDRSTLLLSLRCINLMQCFNIMHNFCHRKCIK